jgi:hypothetical protein
MLAGKHVVFTLQGKAGTASQLRISIYDGVTRTYSDYNSQITGWTQDSEPLTVEATIGDSPSTIEFAIHYETAATTAYVDDARVISGVYRKVYIGDLGLQKNKPHQVLGKDGDNWYLLHDIEYVDDSMYLPGYILPGYELKVVGAGYLDFLVSGVSSTLWTAEIDIDDPQLKILVANAIINLYTIMSLPNFDTGDRKTFQETINYFKAELKDRVKKYGMRLPAATMNFTV